MKGLLCVISAVFLAVSAAHAEHPRKVVEETLRGEHYEALLTLASLPKGKRTTEALLAGYKSARALSANKYADSLSEEVLGKKELDNEQTGEIYFQKAVSAFQEGDYQLSEFYLEKSKKLLKSERADISLLEAEILEKSDKWGKAADKYLEALDNASSLDKPEIAYRLGICRKKLAQPSLARSAFESVPLSHPRAKDAMIQLLLLAGEEEKWKDVSFWAALGKKHFPEAFGASEILYVRMKSAVSRGEASLAEEILQQARENHPPSDHWVTLIEAVYEVYQNTRRGLA